MSQLYLVHHSQILKQLCESTANQLNNKIVKLKNNKLAIFGAGPTGKLFYKALREDFDVQVDLFIDNNKELDGKMIEGVEVKYQPWLYIPDFFTQYDIIVAASWDNYNDITIQLDKLGMHENISFNSFITAKLMPRYLAITDLLNDELSKCSYLASIYCLMTNDNQFIQYAGEQYVSHPKFATFGKNDIIVDAGAYVGDSAEVMLKRTQGWFSKMFLFEPFEEAYEAINARKQRWCKEWNIEPERIILVEAGLSVKSGYIGMQTAVVNGSPSFYVFKTGDISVQVYSLDDFFKDCPPPTFIKADIEGNELDMLYGAKDLLVKHRPLLAISIYHSSQEMATIAEYLISLDCGYKFDVRNHTTSAGDTILYCWV